MPPRHLDRAQQALKRFFLSNGRQVQLPAALAVGNVKNIGPELLEVSEAGAS